MFSRLFVVLNAISIMLTYIELNWGGEVIQRLAGTDFHVGFTRKIQ